MHLLLKSAKGVLGGHSVMVIFLFSFFVPMCTRYRHRVCTKAVYPVSNSQSGKLILCTSIFMS